MLNTIIQVLASDLQFISRSIILFNIGSYDMFPGRYLKNEWPEVTTYTHLFDVPWGDLPIEGVFRYTFHRE